LRESPATNSTLHFGILAILGGVATFFPHCISVWTPGLAGMCALRTNQGFSWPLHSTSGAYLLFFRPVLEFCTQTRSELNRKLLYPNYVIRTLNAQTTYFSDPNHSTRPKMYPDQTNQFKLPDPTDLYHQTPIYPNFAQDRITHLNLACTKTQITRSDPIRTVPRPKLRDPNCTETQITRPDPQNTQTVPAFVPYQICTHSSHFSIKRYPLLNLSLKRGTFFWRLSEQPFFKGSPASQENFVQLGNLLFRILFLFSRHFVLCFSQHFVLRFSRPNLIRPSSVL